MVYWGGEREGEYVELPHKTRLRFIRLQHLVEQLRGFDIHAFLEVDDYGFGDGEGKHFGEVWIRLGFGRVMIGKKEDIYRKTVRILVLGIL